MFPAALECGSEMDGVCIGAAPKQITTTTADRRFSTTSTTGYNKDFDGC